MVSIVVATYNHARYIGEAIESFLMQETDFRVEILVNDDASTDDTAAVVREYEQRHPDLFVTFYQTENQYSQGKKPWFHVLFPAAKGKYIALCEGDDYWTDPLKLQKQVDFLEGNTGYSMCFHPVKVWRNGQLHDDDITREVLETTTAEDLLLGNYIHTPSVMFRNNLFGEFPKEFYSAPIADYFLHMLNAQHGKIRKLKDVMAVYRVHSGGIHSSNSAQENAYRWVITLHLMHKAIEGELGKKLASSCFRCCEYFLLNNPGLCDERKLKCQQIMVELDGNYFLTMMTEKEQLRANAQQLQQENRMLRDRLWSGKHALRVLWGKLTSNNRTS